jgi:hypothetical protein
VDAAAAQPGQLSEPQPGAEQAQHVVPPEQRELSEQPPGLLGVDSTPLPCAASRETVKHSELAGHDGYGSCKSHHRYFWGLSPVCACRP